MMKFVNRKSFFSSILVEQIFGPISSDIYRVYI